MAMDFYRRLMICFLVIFIDTSIGESNQKLNVEVPAENHLTFPLLVEKRMVNAISTLLYIRENELQDVIVSSQSVNIVDGQREDDYWLNENDTVAGEEKVRASKKITAQVKGNKFLKNGEPMYTYAHDLPARITMDFFQDNDTLTKRKQKEITVALLASGSPVTNTVQRLGGPINDTIRSAIRKMKEKDSSGSTKLSPVEFKEYLENHVMEDLVKRFEAGSNYTFEDEEGNWKYETTQIFCKVDGCQSAYRKNLVAKKEQIFQDANARLRTINNLPNVDVIDFLDRNEVTEIKPGRSFKRQFQNLSEADNLILQKIADAKVPTKPASTLKAEIRFLQIEGVTMNIENGFNVISVADIPGKTPTAIPYNSPYCGCQCKRRRGDTSTDSCPPISKRARLDEFVNKMASSSMEDIAIKTQTSIKKYVKPVVDDLNKVVTAANNFKKLKKVLSKLASCLQYLDGAMAVFGLIQMFLPESDSPELAYMKSQFGIVNTKLDSVLTGQEKLSAAIDFLSLTNHIDVAKIEIMNELVVSFLPELRNELAINGNLSTNTKYKLENFKTQFDQSDLVFITQTLLWSVTDPQKAAIGVEKDILALYQDKNTNDCKATLEFGFRVIQHLRKARPVTNFYYQFQVLSEAPIKWDDELYKVIEKTHLQAHSCLKDSQSFVKQDMGNFINNNNNKPSDIASTLRKKYFVHDYFVIKLDTTDEFEHHAIYNRYSSVMEKKQGNDKNLIVIERPYSRSKVNDIDEIKSKIESWCNLRENEYQIEANEVIERISRKLGNYKQSVRAITAIWNYGGGDSGNFDIDMTCDKKHYWLIPNPIGLFAPPIHHHTTTTYQILIVLQNPKTPASEPCFGGQRLALTKDGNEEFCLCNRGYTGDECEEKIVRPSASILDMPELEVWKKKLKVPGMFDLMDAIEKSAEAITSHVTEEADRVIESIENLGDQTIDAIEKSAVESAQFVKSLTQNFQVSQELRLDGISKQLTRSFTSFELKLVEGTNMVMNELTSFRSSVSDGIRKLTCLANRNDLYPDIRIFEDTLNTYSDNTDTDGKQIYLNLLKKDYLEYFKNEKLPNLKRALMGRTGIGRGQSLIETEMACFNPKQFCSESYHQLLRYQEAELLILYYQVRNFQQLMIDEFSDIQTITPNLTGDIEEDLTDLEDLRSKSSCPSFEHDQLNGGGCQPYSTYNNQKIDLRELCPNQTTPVNSVTMTPVTILKCEGSYGNLAWNIDPKNITCIPYCAAYDEGSLIKTPVGEKRSLSDRDGYHWINESGTKIQNVDCLPFYEESIGFFSDEEVHKLEDINECNENNTLLLCPMKNVKKCFNSPGSYQCLCEEGYYQYDNSDCTYSTNQCIKQLPSDDPKMVLCVKNCTGFDPLLDQSFSLAFQENKPLIQDPAYTWKNENDEEIASITCNYTDFGGPSEKIDLDYNWTCNAGYHENGKFCSGCNCNTEGSNGIGCDNTDGSCTCKPNFFGDKCEQCAEGFFGFPNCQSCNCNTEGSKGCDNTDGKCTCKPNIYDRKCEKCLEGFSGFPNCLRGSLILVATGNPYTDKCQVVDVSSSTSCGNLPSYPYSMSSAAGGVINNTPIICGGYRSSGSPREQESCYSFNENSNSWNLHTTMKSRRSHHAASVINDTLFISGGYDGSTLASTEFIHADGSVTSGPNLPVAREGHCSVTLHDSKVIIIGGYPSSLYKNVLVFDPADNSYTTGPSMTYNKYNAACTLFHSDLHNGRPVVLAAGGSGQATAEVYDYTNSNEWQTIGSLPTSDTSNFYGARALPSTTGKGAYLQMWEFLYELRCTTASCTWSVMEKKLTTRVRISVMMTLPKNFTCPN